MSIAGLLLLIIAGCRNAPKIENAHVAFYNGDLDASAETLQALRESNDSQRLPASMDLAIVHLARGEHKQAEKLLIDARDTLDANDGLHPVESLRSYLADDTVRSYSGSGYEHVMVRAMLAINNVMRGGGDAEAFGLQAQMKQQQLQRRASESGFLNADKNFHPIALAPYLRGVMREANHQDYDDASRAYRLVSQIRPAFAPAKVDIQRAEHGTHTQAGNGALYVFAFVGLGPVKVAETAEVTSDVVLAADRILSRVGKYSVPPTLARIAIPAVQIPDSRVDTVHVAVGQQSMGLTQSLTDVGQMAQLQFEAERKELLVRAVARRAVKKVAVTAAKDAMNIENKNAQLIVDLIGSAWEATEKTDTRCWGLLPRDIQVLRAELPAGTHDVSFLAFGQGSPLQRVGTTKTIEIEDGRNTYVLALASTSNVLVRVPEGYSTGAVPIDSSNTRIETAPVR